MGGSAERRPGAFQGLSMHGYRGPLMFGLGSAQRVCCVRPYLLEVVGKVLRFVQTEGLAGDERRADGVDALQDLLQVPVGLQRRQPQLDDQPVQLCVEGVRIAG